MMMRFRVATVAGAAVLAVAGSASFVSAQSDFRETLECVSNGSLQACSSFQVTTEDYGSGTNVWIRIQNRDMDVGYQQLLVGFGLVAPGLEGVDFDPTEDIAVEDPATIVRTGAANDEQVLSEWALGTTLQPGGGTSLEFSANGTSKPDGTGSTNSAIAGCFLSSTVAVGSLVTCGDEDGDGSSENIGWVVFNFQTTNRWYASDAQLAYRYKSVGPTDASLTCPESDLNCTSEVLPEPASLVLLGSGLLGLGAVGYIRRRREDDPTEV